MATLNIIANLHDTNSHKFIYRLTIGILSVLVNIADKESAYLTFQYSLVCGTLSWWCRVSYNRSDAGGERSRVLTGNGGAAVALGDAQEWVGVGEAGGGVEHLREARLQVGADGRAAHGRRGRDRLLRGALQLRDTYFLYKNYNFFIIIINTKVTTAIGNCRSLDLQY